MNVDVDVVSVVDGKLLEEGGSTEFFTGYFYNAFQQKFVNDIRHLTPLLQFTHPPLLVTSH